MIWFPFWKKPSTADQKVVLASLTRSFSTTGITFRVLPAGAWPPRALAYFGPQAELAQLLAQIEEEGFASSDGDHVTVAWADVYRLMASSDYAESVRLLDLPPVEHWRPSLDNKGSLTDADFSIRVSGWTAPNGRMPRSHVLPVGAVLQVEGKEILLPEKVWQVLEAVAALDRLRKERGALDVDTNRRAWSAIRAKAVGVANLSNFLAKTVVLTPEKLTINLRKTTVAGDKVVEVVPGFEDQPQRWLEMFDRLNSVRDRYDIPDGEGLTHVLVSPEAQTVLREIKRMVGRRVAGDRAEAFIRNPFAALGPAAEVVVDPEQFERARDAAGITFPHFVADVKRDDNGYPFEVRLQIEEILADSARVEEYKFEGAAELERFLNKLDARMAAGTQCCNWDGFDLEILGDTSAQAEILRHALAEMRKPQGVGVAELLDLSRYSERIAGFGVEKAYYSPYIAKKKEDEGWYPDNVEFGWFYTPEGGGETLAIPLDQERMSDFREAVAQAKENGLDALTFPGCPKPIPVAQAETIVETFAAATQDVREGNFDPEQVRTKEKAGTRKGLVIKSNVDKLDYEERRGGLTGPEKAAPKLPMSLRPEISLKDHQLEGVAWLQHLWSRSPHDCRGALLADDMGLGKTLQLLTFMAALLEEQADMDPFLVVAPVSLLDNWQEEISRFFQPGTFSLLTLYGDNLARSRLPSEDIDQELAQGGITRLLRRNWLGRQNMVLTTYETLRDIEFSLALQKWSVIVCDEAQKIKNPNAMVTRSAKKQNARFKIACTGTPVENTLTDLWCLFDFVQPGLLGALSEFGQRYRKPIEVKTDEERARVEELRDKIRPQTLRRIKSEVAKDLPKKIEVPQCRSLPISSYQRQLYAGVMSRFRQRADHAKYLELLHYLRRICSDPRHPGTVGTDRDTVAEIENRSPKVAWLIRQLESIRTDGEKVILFCEFRDLQRVLQRVVSERFGFVPEIINGDTSAASEVANNRQRRIRAFQARPGFGTIILSPLAVGFGVNIQAANHVIHFTRSWNPAKEDQATDRAYRIGQTRDVFVYYLVVVADDFRTFDAKLDELLNQKRQLSSDMLDGTGDLRPADLIRDLDTPDGEHIFEDKVLTPIDLESLDGDAFETFCAVLWSKQGYKAERTPKAGDGGVDVVAIAGRRGVLIQCKSSSVDGRELGWDAVKEVVAGKAAYAACHPGVDFSLLAVTNRRFNGTARGQAQLNQVELIDGEGLAEYLKKHPVLRSELNLALL
ncbi:MAG: restriction endonuclease [Magnetococcales bacterium]|nr:restriction endonuclease [Magnetococcales bacterium]